MKSALGLLLSLVVCFAAAGVGGLFTASSVDGWYAGLDKPAFTPPNAVFGPVWTVLYAMMAIAAWLVWRKAGFGHAPLALGLFAIQLLVNVSWSAVFFGLRRPDLGLIDIIVLLIAIAATTIAFARISAVAAGLMVPYLLWVGYATALNAALWWMNR